MNKGLTLILAILALLAMAAATPAPCYWLNPYEPYNAPAAEPPTPYNLWNIPQVSRTFYLPCCCWAPFADKLPDVPPVWQPFPGPFGIPVSVP